MTQKSRVTIDNLSLWDFDQSAISKGLSEEGKVFRAEARRLVAREAISEAGDYPGKRTGKLSDTISYKKFRNQLGLFITHKMKKGQFRYPFALVHGAPEQGLDPRADYIADTFESRKPYVQQMLRNALKKSFKAEDIVL